MSLFQGGYNLLINMTFASSLVQSFLGTFQFLALLFIFSKYKPANHPSKSNSTSSHDYLGYLYFKVASVFSLILLLSLNINKWFFFQLFYPFFNFEYICF